LHAAAAPAVNNNAEVAQGSSHVACINCFAAEYLGDSSGWTGAAEGKARRAGGHYCKRGVRAAIIAQAYLESMSYGLHARSQATPAAQAAASRHHRLRSR
jgi:hypothetical protein